MRTIAGVLRNLMIGLGAACLGASRGDAQASSEPASTGVIPGSTIHVRVVEEEPAPAAEEEEEEEEPGYEITAGIDLYTRFVWRGVSFGDQWTLQPNADISTHGFTTSIWAASAIDEGSLVDFAGLELSYEFGGDWGSFELDVADWIVTQHYLCSMPDPVDPDVCLSGWVVDTKAPYLTDFSGNGEGSHWIDATVSYSGPSAFPLHLEFGMVLYNDPDYSKYLGVSVPIELPGGFTITPELGMVFGQSLLWYQTDDDPVNVTNCALDIARTVELGRGVSLPLSVQTIVNPEARRLFIVGAIGLRI